jgi:hypothetical protein
MHMYELTSRSSLSLMKVVATQLLKRFLSIYGIHDSLAYSQEQTTGHNPNQMNPHFSLYLFVIHFSIIFQSTARSNKRSLPSWFSNQNFVLISDISHAHYMPAHLISKHLYFSHNINILLVL